MDSFMYSSSAPPASSASFAYPPSSVQPSAPHESFPPTQFVQQNEFLSNNATFYGVPVLYQPITQYDPAEVIFEKTCYKYGISVFERTILKSLTELAGKCSYVCVIDDSGSMAQVSLINTVRTTRWNEAIENLKMLIEFVSVFTNEGVDVHFLNGPSIEHVKTSEQLFTFMQQYQITPDGGTPLTEKITSLFASSKYKSNKQVNTYIFTDGEPDDGYKAFYKLIKERDNAILHPITLIACTSDKTAIGWMNKLDKNCKNIDVVDDYKNETTQIMEKQNKNKDFQISIGTYLLKILFGSFVKFYDLLDEKDVRSCSHIDFEKQKQKGCAIC
jgi:hypothetical protein